MKMVDIAFIEISTSAGNVELTTVEEFEPNITDKKKPVATMNRNRRPIGKQRGIPEFSADMTVVIPLGKQEVDWEQLMLSGEEFLITYEESEGGRRFSFVRAWVDELSKPFKV